MADETPRDEEAAQNQNGQPTDEPDQASKVGDAGDGDQSGPALPPLMQSIVDAMAAAFPDLETTARDDGWVEAVVPKERWAEVAQTLRDDPNLNFDYLSMVSAVDYEEKGFQVVYHLLSLMANKKLVVKVDAPERDDPVVPSVVHIWPTADFHEREAWDLMGVRFEGHPDLRRILMREDWVGHPLRKDYVDDRAPRERKTKENYFEIEDGKSQLNA